MKQLVYLFFFPANAIFSFFFQTRLCSGLVLFCQKTISTLLAPPPNINPLFASISYIYMVIVLKLNLSKNERRVKPICPQFEAFYAYDCFSIGKLFLFFYWMLCFGSLIFFILLDKWCSDYCEIYIHAILEKMMLIIVDQLIPENIAVLFYVIFNWSISIL